MRSYLPSLALTLVLAIGVLFGVKVLQAGEAPTKPRNTTPGHVAGLTKVEVVGDMVVVSTQLPPGCELPEWAAYELVGGTPRIGRSVEKPHARCTFKDDTTGHQATFTFVDPARNQSADTLFSASIPAEEESSSAIVTRPAGIAQGAWAQVDDLADGRRRFIVVWHDYSFVSKLVVRRWPTSDASTDLEAVLDVARRVANGWEPPAQP